jgi:hypothetical protein
VETAVLAASMLEKVAPALLVLPKRSTLWASCDYGNVSNIWYPRGNRAHEIAKKRVVHRGRLSVVYITGPRRGVVLFSGIKTRP